MLTKETQDIVQEASSRVDRSHLLKPNSITFQLTVNLDSIAKVPQCFVRRKTSQTISSQIGSRCHNHGVTIITVWYLLSGETSLTVIDTAFLTSIVNSASDGNSTFVARVRCSRWRLRVGFEKIAHQLVYQWHGQSCVEKVYKPFRRIRDYLSDFNAHRSTFTTIFFEFKKWIPCREMP